ncbi:MAG TPA: glutamate--tRNA ligase family protein [Gemmatimonadales bacterium]|nr:glutamate--tRNA ligase family protein [Gemmatimonadales bacterium]
MPTPSPRAQGRELFERVRARSAPGVLTRFAPAPTGWLHLGHLVNAVWVWGLARALGGRVLLRVEDHDRTRCRPEYQAGLVEDLEWLGLEPDGGLTPLLRQSDRGAVYEAELRGLEARGLAYGCRCSRKDIATAAGDAPDLETPYPGTCRALGVPLDPGLGARVPLEPGAEMFDDLRLGPRMQEPARQCGDLLARDRLGNWTYQFCVVVDDRDQDVELVIRGEDLLESTGRQIRLARLLGRPRPPHFLHHPLIRRPDGSKLSKANRDTGLRDLRAAGQSAASLLGEAAARAGLLDRPRALRAADLPSLFTG